MATSQFEEWMDDYEAELREGVQKRFGLTDGISDKSRLDDEKQEKGQGEPPTSELARIRPGEEPLAPAGLGSEQTLYE